MKITAKAAKYFFLSCMIFYMAMAVFSQENGAGNEADKPDTEAASTASADRTFEENSVEAARYSTIRYGTETEIAALIQSLKNENADYLDDELMALIDNTRNQNILTGVFSFFGARNKSGLEDRAIRAVEEWDEEAGETVQTAMDYLGKVKSERAIEPLKAILDQEERRFMNTAFRALGQASGVSREAGDSAAEFLVDYYTNRDPGDENRREIITALGNTASSKAVPFLAETAGNNEERTVLRIAALDSLGKIGNEGGMEAVIASVSDKDPNVRSAAVAALGPFSGEAVDNAILDAFRDSYYRTRIAAARASRDRKFEKAIPYLRFRAERDDVATVKDEAIRALGAIGGSECVSILNTLFSERKNSDQIRIVSAEMLMKNTPDSSVDKLIVELDEAKRKNQTPLYNGFLKVIGESKTPKLEDITRRFLSLGGIIEKSYGLDMTMNNDFRGLSAEVTALKNDKNVSLARKAARTMEALGIKDAGETPANPEP
jgi:HEAT repeat protein